MELGNWKSTSVLPDGQARACLVVANGMTSKEGARIFGVSHHTINAALNQIKEKLNGNYDNTGKRAWVVTEAIRRGWLSPLMVLLFISSIVSGLVGAGDIEMRRTSNRLSSRSVASRMVRGRRTRETVDFEFEDMTPELLQDFFESTPNTLAPWSSVVMNKDVPLTNEMRLELWRDLFQSQVQLT